MRETAAIFTAVFFAAPVAMAQTALPRTPRWHATALGGGPVSAEVRPTNDGTGRGGLGSFGSHHVIGFGGMVSQRADVGYLRAYRNAENGTTGGGAGEAGAGGIPMGNAPAGNGSMAGNASAGNGAPGGVAPAIAPVAVNNGGPMTGTQSMGNANGVTASPASAFNNANTTAANAVGARTAANGGGFDAVNANAVNNATATLAGPTGGAVGAPGAFNAANAAAGNAVGLQLGTANANTFNALAAYGMPMAPSYYGTNTTSSNAGASTGATRNAAGSTGTTGNAGGSTGATGNAGATTQSDSAWGAAYYGSTNSGGANLGPLYYGGSQSWAPVYYNTWQNDGSSQ